MGRVTAVVSDDLEARARAKAALERRQIGDVIREALERYVAGGLPGYREEARDAEGA